MVRLMVRCFSQPTTPPGFLDFTRVIGGDIQRVVEKAAPHAQIWVGETAASWWVGSWKSRRPSVAAAACARPLRRPHTHQQRQRQRQQQQQLSIQPACARALARIYLPPFSVWTLPN